VAASGETVKMTFGNLALRQKGKLATVFLLDLVESWNEIDPQSP
jgi:hypothetical protein